MNESAAQIVSDREAYYRQRADQLEREVTESSRRWRWLGFLRGGIFLLALAGLVAWGTNQLGLGSGWLWIAGGVFLGFLAAAYFHELLGGSIFVGRMRLKMYRESIDRLARKLSSLDVHEPDLEAQQLGLARDLDLTGRNSLYRLLGTVRTPLGQTRLLGWMFQPIDAREINLRQSSVIELRDQVAWRENFQLISEQLSVSDAGPSRFIEWVESSNWVDRHRWLLWLSRACFLTFAAGLVSAIAGWLPLAVVGPTLMVSCAVSFLFSVMYAGPIHDIMNQISARQEDARCYIRLFRCMREYSPKAERLRELHSRLFEQGDLKARLDQLSWLTWLANWRKHGIFFLAYIFLQLIAFWDIHILALLEHWKKTNSAKAKAWFDDLAEWEVLSSLAKLAWDHPDWCFPSVRAPADPKDIKLTAQGLGHPLLPPKLAVPNDVAVGPPGTLLLVTGSNMSGKSTLLRSIGLNVVLAQMGGPTCATKLELVPMELATSMRISDSLADGVSFFMAELKRLKEVVDRARQIQRSGAKGQLFLLDEILQGTNSRERQIAVGRVLSQLLTAGSIGAVSTHDLELAGLEELREACQPVYFCESFREANGKRTMTFDYKMHAGISPTTNALKLLELVGLE